MKEMNLRKTVLFFGLPGLAMFLAFQFLLPIFLELGLAMNWSLFICTWSPIVILTVFVLVEWKKSKNNMKEFFWIRNLNKKEWIITIMGLAFVLIAEELLGGASTIMTSLPGFSAPEWFPELFKPGADLTLPLKSFMGMELKGNLSVLWFWALWIVVNIGCEEILWRGYALPRMEMKLGKWAWLVNGLLWNLVIHFFMRWNMIGMLPVSLIVPYLSQKTKSLWPGVVIHGFGNFMLYIFIVPSIFQ